MKYEEFITRNQRLFILQFLAGDGTYSHNDTVIQMALAAGGHDVSADKLKTELAWLVEQGLITTEPLGGLIVAKLTVRGLDVAKGRSQVPGVDRPGPGQ